MKKKRGSGGSGKLSYFLSFPFMAMGQKIRVPKKTYWLKEK